MILKFIEFYEKYDYLFAVFLSIIMWTVGYFSKQFSVQLKKMRVSKLFRLKRENVEILIPDRHGKLTLSSTGGATELTDSFVTKGEMEAAIKLREEINKLGLYATILSRPTEDKANNIFCIGGPLSNVNTAIFFRNRTIFNPITFGIHKDSQYISGRNRKNLADLIHEDGNDETGRQQGSIRLRGEQIFSFDREYGGYIFLAKLSDQVDFHNDEKGVLHICFGNNSLTTLSAVRCYFKGNRLNKLLKNKKHYCVIIGCDANGNLNFNDYHDLTNEMLVQKSQSKKTIIAKNSK